MGPWVHGVGATKAEKSGDREFGPAAAIDYDETVLRFMDRYLRGIDNGLDREKRARVFVMGENAWREGDGWPLAADAAAHAVSLACRRAARAGSVTEAAAVRGGRHVVRLGPGEPGDRPVRRIRSAHTTTAP